VRSGPRRLRRHPGKAIGIAGIAFPALRGMPLLHQLYSPEDRIVWIIFAIAAAILLLLYLRSLARNRRFTESAERMTIVSREMARGALDRRIDAAAIEGPELRELASSINAMANRATGDIAEMKRLERVRSEFLGNVSHELRTPIFSVQGYLETLIDGAIEDPDVRDDFLAKAHQNVLRLHSLLTDLIEISRIESGEMKMSFRYFDIVDHVRHVIDELIPTAEMAGVSIHLVVQGDREDGLTVWGDRERLKQVMINLIENAIKYNRPDGEVTVELESAPGGVMVRVKDTGIGIPQEDLGRIFERFYRVNKDRSRAVGGSGLGLAIVKHIIEAHRTRITVESELGVGTTFSFVLSRSGESGRRDQSKG
jgi:two-component system phosphate regulon sensor histidine kinase PhoR